MLQRLATVLVLIAIEAPAPGQGLSAPAPPGGPAGAGPNTAPPPLDPAMKALVEARMNAAREVYQAEIQRYTQTMALAAAETAEWSKRWMEGQLALATSPTEALVAIRDHVDRVIRLDQIASANLKAGQGSRSDAWKVRYHRHDAELTFAEAKAAYPGVAIPAPAAPATPAAAPATAPAVAPPR